MADPLEGFTLVAPEGATATILERLRRPTEGQSRSVGGMVQAIGDYLANPPGWRGVKAGVQSTGQALANLPGAVLGIPEQVAADMRALTTRPEEAIPAQAKRAGTMLSGMVPFRDTMEEVASGRRPSPETFTKGATELALSMAIPMAGGAALKGATRGAVKILPGAGVGLQEEAISRAGAMMGGLRKGGSQAFLSDIMGDEASAVVRGEQIQQGLKNIAQAHRVGEAVEWEFPQAHETGVPDFRIDNLREHMRRRVAEREDLQQAITPSTATRLSSPGGITTPEGAFVTEQMTRSGTTASGLMKGLAQGEEPLTLRQAMTLRKILGEMYEAGDRGPLAAFRQDMEADAEFNPARAKAWEAARAYTRDNVVPFYSDQPLGRLIDKGEPVAVMGHLLRDGDKSITTLRALAAQTGEAGPTWEAVRQEAFSRAVKSPDVYYTMGPETRTLLFRADEEAALRRAIAADELDRQVGKAVGKSGESFSSFSVNRVSKWIDQQERSVGFKRADPKGELFVQSFSAGERADIKATLQDISKHMAALPSMTGTPVGSAQRIVHAALGEAIGGMTGGLTGRVVGPFAGITAAEGISRALQTTPGRAFIRRAIRIAPITSPEFNQGLGAFLRSQIPTEQETQEPPSTVLEGLRGTRETPGKVRAAGMMQREMLSRKDPRYNQARNRGLTDQDLEQRFGLQLGE